MWGHSLFGIPLFPNSFTERLKEKKKRQEEKRGKKKKKTVETFTAFRTESSLCSLTARLSWWLLTSLCMIDERYSAKWEPLNEKYEEELLICLASTGCGRDSQRGPRAPGAESCSQELPSPDTVIHPHPSACQSKPAGGVFRGRQGRLSAGGQPQVPFSSQAQPICSD